MANDIVNPEKIAEDAIAAAFRMPGVKVDRSEYLTKTFQAVVPPDVLSKAVETTPSLAGIPKKAIEKAASDAIRLETGKASALSFAAGLPGGFALAATIPADAAQYLAHSLRVAQKLAFLYGWASLDVRDGSLDDGTLAAVTLLLGVMMGVGAANKAIAKFANEVAAEAVVKAVGKVALTKTAFYPVLKKTLAAIGVKLTTESFAKGVGKVVPVVGGVVSAGLTVAGLVPGANNLRKHLRSIEENAAEYAAQHSADDGGQGETSLATREDEPEAER